MISKVLLVVAVVAFALVPSQTSGGALPLIPALVPFGLACFAASFLVP